MSNVRVLERQKEVFISSTLYRTLFVLKLLFLKPMSIAEIKDECIKDNVIGTKISDDTIRMTISTLKSLGCNFTKPNLKNNFKYEMLSCPFKYNLSDKDIEFLSDLRKQLAPVISLSNLEKLNNFYEKINKKMNDSSNKFDLSRENIYPNIDIFIFVEMLLLCRKNVYVNVLYNSKNGLKSLNIVPYFMKYENDTVYVWCYNEQYETFSYLRLDKVVRINDILSEKRLPDLNKNKVILKIKNDKIAYFETFYTIKILSSDNLFCEVEVEYMNDFHIVQTILELSPDCYVVSNDVIKNKIKEKIDFMKRRYKL